MVLMLLPMEKFASTNHSVYVYYNKKCTQHTTFNSFHGQEIALCSLCLLHQHAYITDNFRCFHFVCVTPRPPKQRFDKYA